MSELKICLFFQIPSPSLQLRVARNPRLVNLQPLLKVIFFTIFGGIPKTVPFLNSEERAPKSIASVRGSESHPSHLSSHLIRDATLKQLDCVSSFRTRLEFIQIVPVLVSEMCALS